MLARGQRWCRDCEAWLPAECVTKNALCRPHENARGRAAYAANPDPYRRRTAARKRLRLHPPREAAAVLLSLFDGRCAYCPAPADTWDHVQPLARGGRTVPGNIVPACRPCNASKGKKALEVWITGRAGDCHPELFDTLILAEAV